MKRAMILGVGGQDGSYLAEILLEKGYDVHGLHRRSSVDNLRRIAHIRDRISLHRGDMADPLSIHRAIHRVEPQEIYNEADQDDVRWSQSIPAYSFDITAAAVGRLLEIVRTTNAGIKLFQPVSAMMFGSSPMPQREDSPLAPSSPFGCAKAAAYYLCQHYRREHGLFVSTAILFNHDSPARSEDYVLHKICRAAVRIARGTQDKLPLGNLQQQIDIGFARDYMLAAWQMMQMSYPGDYVIGTGAAWTIGEMVRESFRCAGVKGDWQDYVTIDPAFYRANPPTLIADPTKARQDFDFRPAHSIQDLIRMIVKHEQEHA